MHIYFVALTDMQFLHIMHTAFVVLIGVSNREKLYCSSNDFLESFLAETSFCTLSGMFIYWYHMHAYNIYTCISLQNVVTL